MDKAPGYMGKLITVVVVCGINRVVDGHFNEHGVWSG